MPLILAFMSDDVHVISPCTYACVCVSWVDATDSLWLCRECVGTAHCSLPHHRRAPWNGAEGCSQSSCCDLGCSAVSEDPVFVAAVQGPALFCRLGPSSAEHSGNSHWVLTTWSVCVCVPHILVVQVEQSTRCLCVWVNYISHEV